MSMVDWKEDREQTLLATYWDSLQKSSAVSRTIFRDMRRSFEWAPSVCM